MSSWRTGWLSPISRPSTAPVWVAAFRLAVTTSSGSVASTTRSPVMILVTLAMARRSSGFRSHSTRPESRSTSRAEAAATRGRSVDGGGVSRAVGYGDGEPAAALEMTAEEVAAATGVDVSVVEAMASFGILRPHHGQAGTVYGGDDVAVLRIVKDLFKYGVEPRHLTMYRHFADRESTFFEQIVVPILRQRNPEARRLARESLTELAGISRRLKQALLRANLRRHLSA